MGLIKCQYLEVGVGRCQIFLPGFSVTISLLKFIHTHTHTNTHAHTHSHAYYNGIELETHLLS